MSDFKVELIPAKPMRCPVHGEIDGNRYSVWFMADGEPTDAFCFLCYRDWMRANISQLEPATTLARPTEEG